MGKLYFGQQVDDAISVFKKGIEKLSQDKEADLAKRACLREWKRELDQAVKLPSSFIKKFTKTTSQAIHVWAKAKQKKDFSLFHPYLKQVIALSQKKANFLGYKEHPYDALLDLYEPGLTVAILTPMFETLKNSLLDLLQKIQTKPLPSLSSLGSYAEETQMALLH